MAAWALDVASRFVKTVLLLGIKTFLVSGTWSKESLVSLSCTLVESISYLLASFIATVVI